MRVVAGEYGGRRIEAPRGRSTRPTSARTREALFSMLGDVSGTRVLDLFAGSGALGIEALSRGAAHATFVDSGQSAIAAISLNLGQLGLQQRALVERLDARQMLARGETYDLVFVDPPYSKAADLGPLLARELPARLSPGARVVSESDRRAPLELGLPTIRERRYGDTLIRIHQLEAP
ncbi:MAG TPA: 16S rRNA (guanine(966)-N(2))-methyltransferase RsmD [Solirubrobacteraceae bacterium]|nr:16S rRNA (guanine(966)-N(2))-methyltransferase RsmD [Solirubrobacteraceae bacterium]